PPTHRDTPAPPDALPISHHGQRGGGQGAVPGQRVSGRHRLRRRVLHRLRQGGGGPGGEAPPELGENERDLEGPPASAPPDRRPQDRKSTRLNSSHVSSSY